MTLRVSSCLILLLLPAWASALPEDRKQPINLEADKGSYNQRTGVSVYQGNVVVTQGTMKLVADEATVYFKNGEFEKMHATGTPSELRYKPTHDKPWIDGVGDEVRYNAVTAKVVVIGNARFVQGKDIFEGDRIEYDLSTDIVRANSRQGERIKIILQPTSSGTN